MPKQQKKSWKLWFSFVLPDKVSRGSKMCEAVLRCSKKKGSNSLRCTVTTLLEGIRAPEPSSVVGNPISILPPDILAYQMILRVDDACTARAWSLVNREMRKAVLERFNKSEFGALVPWTLPPSWDPFVMLTSPKPLLPGIPVRFRKPLLPLQTPQVV